MKTKVKVLNKDILSQKLEHFRFDILNFTYLIEADNRKSKSDILDGFKILIMLRGEACVYIGEDRYYISTNDCVLLPPGTLYRAEFINEERCEFISLLFMVKNIKEQNEFKKLFNIGKILITPKLVPEYTKQFIMSTFHGIENNSPGYYYNVLLLLQRLLCLILYKSFDNEAFLEKAIYHKSSQERTVFLCHQYLLNNSHTAVTVADLCGACHVSQSYLYRCVKKIFNISTKDFILKTRLSKTELELKQTDKTITQIAAEFGFSNSYQYSNIFKKLYGMSPSKFRNNCKNQRE